MGCAEGTALDEATTGGGGSTSIGGSGGVREGGAGGALSTTSTASNGGAGLLSAGDLLITEVMANPDVASDTYAEWIELYNTTTETIDLRGLVFRHEASDPATVHTIAQSIKVGPGAYVVLGKSADTGANGGVSVAYVYPPDIGFTNVGDYLAIERPDQTIIDHMFWDTDAPKGASLTLDPNFYDASLNDDGSHYCPGKTLLMNGDRGTPGKANDTCP